MLVFPRGRELLEYKTDEVPFLLYPYIPALSTVILHGYPSVGKTPLAWALAQAVAVGGTLFGEKARQGNALLVSFDMPRNLVENRWSKAVPPFKPEFGIVTPEHGSVSVDSYLLTVPWADSKHREIGEVLRAYQDKYKPVFVAIDSLRKVVRGDLNAPGIADRVYEVWHTLFPDATTLFVHHENKDKDPFGSTPHMQKAKGSMEFVDVAQVGLRMAVGSKGTHLIMTKSQASEMLPPRLVRLAKDGVYILGG
jgi:hypothetical protein